MFERNKHQALAWMMWFLTSTFFAYQFILRVSPALIVDQIMSKFGVDAAAYGSLSGMYYLGYAIFQIPLALFLDRYGPKFVGFLCTFVCSASLYVFVYSDNWYLLIGCRFLIGAASAAGFLTVSKVISMWFNPSLYGRMVGITFSIGLLGAVYGSQPVGALIDVFGWKETMYWVSVVGVVLSLMILFFVRNLSTFVENENKNILGKLKIIISNWQLIFIALANLLLVGALEGFADVWGTAYLTKIFNYTISEASNVRSYIFIGMIVCAPIVAYVAEKIDMHYMLIIFSGVGMATVFFLIVLLGPSINIYIMCAMMFLIGLFCCYQVLVFAIGSKVVEPYLIGITIAFLNTINMLGGTFFHNVIGRVMELFWDGTTQGTLKVYGVDSYNYSILSIPIAALIGSTIFGIIRMKSVLKA